MKSFKISKEVRYEMKRSMSLGTRVGRTLLSIDDSTEARRLSQ